MLLRLLDGRFIDHEQAHLGMVEANISKGRIHLNVNPDLTISLDDGAPEKTLMLKINTIGYQMIEGSSHLALIYRIYYKLLKTNLNPQALLKDPKDKTLLLQASSEDINVNIPKMIKWEDMKLPDEWDLPSETPPTILPPINIYETDDSSSIEQYLDGTVKIRFDHSKPKIPPLIKYNKSRHSFSGSFSATKRDQDLNEYLKQLELNKQKDLKDIKQKGIKEENSQVNLAYYSVDNQPNKNAESDNESLNPTPSDMDGEIDNQLNVIKKPFEIGRKMLNSEFDSKKNKDKRDKHSKSHTKEEKKKNL